MFTYIYKELYILGLYVERYVKRFFKRLARIILTPLKVVGAMFYAVYVAIDRMVLDSAQNAKDRNKKREQKSRDRAKPEKGVRLSYVLNTVAPVAAFIIMCVTIHYMNNMKLGLKITYNNADIGYVDTEAVYLEAQDKVDERLETAIHDSDSKTVGKDTTYEIVRVKLTDLNDSESISKKMIERSGSNITNACGIYVDGEFLCAVKNETDAVTVFDNILANYDVGEYKDATVSFVEDIEYVQGIYPDNENTIWDAQRLAERLKGTKNEATYYVVEPGDTPSGIAKKFGISTSELYELNPSAKKNIFVGEKLTLKNEVNFIRVQLTRTETRTEQIPYKTISTPTANLYKGVKKVTKAGSKGEQVITERVTYIDGVRTKVQEISRTVTKEAVNEEVQVGTKAYAYSSYSSGGGSVKSYGGRFIWPAIGAYSISSYFGGRRNHGGIDIIKSGGNSTGCTIVAAGSGTVVSASYHYSWGYNVLVNHGNGIMTRYAHMLPGSFKVHAGQHVNAGTPLGNIGSTGNVTGPHLHFEVYSNGRRVNPMPYLGR